MDVLGRIEQLMERRSWSVYRLGKESGLAQSTLSHVFRRDSEPTISTLETICKAFGMTMGEFFAEGGLVPLTDNNQGRGPVRQPFDVKARNRVDNSQGRTEH